MNIKLVIFTFNNNLALSDLIEKRNDAYYVNAWLRPNDFFVKVCHCSINPVLADYINELTRCQIPMVCLMPDEEMSVVLEPARRYILSQYGADMYTMMCASDKVIDVLNSCCPKYDVYPENVLLISDDQKLLDEVYTLGYNVLNKSNVDAIKGLTSALKL